MRCRAQAAGQPAQRLLRGDHQAPHQRVGLHAAGRGDPLEHGWMRSRPAGTVPAPDHPAGPAGQHPVQEPGRAVPVPDLQAQQAAGLQRADQPVQDQFRVLDPLQQQGGLHDVEGALRQRHRAQVPEQAAGQVRVAAPCGLGDRLVVVDQADGQVGAGRAQASGAQVTGGRDRARQQHGDRLPEPLARVPERPAIEQPRLRGIVWCVTGLRPRLPGLGMTPLAPGNIVAGSAAPRNTAHRCHKHIA